MKRLSKVQKTDYKFVPVEPEVGFSPERNAQVIENSIKKYEAMRRKKIKEHNEGVGERAQALATYLRAKEQGGANSNMEQFFGKQYMDHLKGKILKRIQDSLTVVGSDGRIIRSAGDASAHR